MRVTNLTSNKSSRKVMSHYIHYSGTVYFQDCKCGDRITSAGEPQLFNVPEHLLDDAEIALEKARQDWQDTWDNQVESFLKSHEDCE